jgi:small conductance mechanosensitive channel
MKMPDSAHALGFLREMVWQDIVLVLAILVASRFLVLGARRAVRFLAEVVPARWRLPVLRFSPKLRLLIDAGTLAIILPVVVEPTFHNTVALVATVGLALAFAFKDYGSCLIAGFVTILENTYQPGDWIEIGGNYGEVTSVGLRAVHIVTADDTEIVIPHSQLWSASIANASSGKRSLLCVAPFYLDADHDGAAVRERLAEIAGQSSYLEAGSKIAVIATEKPWGTLYRLKAYVHESREQFLFITDLTLRGKQALRDMNIRFAQAPYAETGKS